MKLASLFFLIVFVPFEAIACSIAGKPNPLKDPISIAFIAILALVWWLFFKKYKNHFISGIICFLLALTFYFSSALYKPQLIGLMCPPGYSLQGDCSCRNREGF